ncbi:Brpf1 protein [Pelomyxa schiedti]|nr:Brpf1 protein [Pelomyxa schiedti]
MTPVVEEASKWGGEKDRGRGSMSGEGGDVKRAGKLLVSYFEFASVLLAAVLSFILLVKAEMTTGSPRVEVATPTLTPALRSAPTSPLQPIMGSPTTSNNGKRSQGGGVGAVSRSMRTQDVDVHQPLPVFWPPNFNPPRQHRHKHKHGGAAAASWSLVGDATGGAAGEKGAAAAAASAAAPAPPPSSSGASSSASPSEAEEDAAARRRERRRERAPSAYTRSHDHDHERERDLPRPRVLRDRRKTKGKGKGKGKGSGPGAKQQQQQQQKQQESGEAPGRRERNGTEEAQEENRGEGDGDAAAAVVVVVPPGKGIEKKEKEEGGEATKEDVKGKVDEDKGEEEGNGKGKDKEKMEENDKTLDTVKDTDMDKEQAQEDKGKHKHKDKDKEKKHKGENDGGDGEQGENGNVGIEKEKGAVGKEKDDRIEKDKDKGKGGTRRSKDNNEQAADGDMHPKAPTKAPRYTHGAHSRCEGCVTRSRSPALSAQSHIFHHHSRDYESITKSPLHSGIISPRIFSPSLSGSIEPCSPCASAGEGSTPMSPLMLPASVCTGEAAGIISPENEIFSRIARMYGTRVEDNLLNKLASGSTSSNPLLSIFTPAYREAEMEEGSNASSMKKTATPPPSKRRCVSTSSSPSKSPKKSCECGKSNCQCKVSRSPSKSLHSEDRHYTIPESYIIYRERIQEDNDDEVEYDLDSEDERFLEEMNYTKEADKWAFEKVMDMLEKTAFKQQTCFLDSQQQLAPVACQCISHFDSATISTFMDKPKCCVCQDYSDDKKNPIYVCCMCNVAAHKACYHIESKTKDHWTCAQCHSSPDTKCKICGTRGVGLTPIAGSKTKQWVHTFCAVWTPGFSFTEGGLVLPNQSFDPGGEEHCSICKLSSISGTVVKCTVPKCNSKFHAICAKLHGHTMFLVPPHLCTSNGLAKLGLFELGKMGIGNSTPASGPGFVILCAEHTAILSGKVPAYKLPHFNPDSEPSDGISKMKTKSCDTVIDFPLGISVCATVRQNLANLNMKVKSDFLDRIFWHWVYRRVCQGVHHKEYTSPPLFRPQGTIILSRTGSVTPHHNPITSAMGIGATPLSRRLQVEIEDVLVSRRGTLALDSDRGVLFWEKRSQETLDKLKQLRTEFDRILTILDVVRTREKAKRDRLRVLGKIFSQPNGPASLISSKTSGTNSITLLPILPPLPTHPHTLTRKTKKKQVSNKNTTPSTTSPPISSSQSEAKFTDSESDSGSSSDSKSTAVLSSSSSPSSPTRKS